MDLENKKIKEAFEKNFISHSGEIVLYGSGVRTKKLLQNIDKEAVAGLMDVLIDEKELYGKKVLTFDELLKLDNPLIIVIARKSVINVAYGRISAFCMQHHIPVYDVNGIRIDSKRGRSIKKDCFALDKNHLLNLAANSDIVMFDIFDTLLVRRVLRATDVFLLVDQSLENHRYVFSNERKLAEEDANRKYGEDNVTIDLIYERMQVNLSLTDDEINVLKNKELVAELSLIECRKSMCDILDGLVKSGKKVILVSDMYIQSTILREILAEKGIKGYSDIFVSCDYGCSKTNGLFKLVLDKTGVSPERCLHIGDNHYSDIEAASVLGIKTFEIYSSVEMLEESIYSGILKEKPSLEENVLISTFAIDAYNDPFGCFDEDGKLIVDDVDIVRRFVAPVIFKYTLWLIKKSEAQALDLMIFPSRDGYLAKKLFDEFKSEKIDSIYFYISRKTALLASSENKEDVKRILDIPDERAFSDMILERFNIKNDYEDAADLSEYDYNKMIDRCHELRHALDNYISSCNITQHKRIGFMDFVAMGTVQKSLEKILNIKMQGLYFVKRTPDEYAKDIECDSLYPESSDYFSEFNVYKYYYFLENIMTSSEPSVSDFNQDDPVFYSEKRNAIQLKKIEECQKAVERYVREMFMVCNINSWKSDISTYDTLLGFISHDYCSVRDSILLNMNNIDEFMGKTISEFNR